MAPSDPTPALSDEPPHQALVVEPGGAPGRVLVDAAHESGLTVVRVGTGAEALEVARTVPIHLVLLDLDLPDGHSLQVLDQLRNDHPELPGVVVADPSNASRLEAALDGGAANFLCKPLRHREVTFVLDRLRRALREEEGLQVALGAVVERRTDLEIPSDLTVIPRVVNLLGREVQCHFPGFHVPLPDIKLALYEALANAVEHGSLEIDFEGKAEAMLDPGGLAELIEQRRRDPRLSRRRVRVSVWYKVDSVEYRVQDEGPGFDPSGFCPQRALDDVQSLHGRGLALIRHYMDEVEWSGRGREIRMVRKFHRRSHAGSAGSDTT
jgi:DNA-binding response OmpR family regulator